MQCKIIIFIFFYIKYHSIKIDESKFCKISFDASLIGDVVLLLWCISNKLKNFLYYLLYTILEIIIFEIIT